MIFNINKQVFLAIILYSLNTSVLAQDNKINIEIKQQNIQVELADSAEKRRIGLMHRNHLAPNNGMLFVFNTIDYHCFWMKNTLIPLSIAFIDQNNTIIDIQEMQAKSLDVHCPSKPISRALEMNLGWFTNHEIVTGTTIKIRP